jgi:hypothetical protein
MIRAREGQVKRFEALESASAALGGSPSPHGVNVNSTA